jgi:hypothetical protein
MSKQKTIDAISEGNRHTNGQQRSDMTIAEKNEMNENKRWNVHDIREITGKEYSRQDG